MTDGQVMEQGIDDISKYKPLHDRIVVQALPLPEKTQGGLYIPGNQDETSVRGTVLAVGPGGIGPDGQIKPTQLKVGQTVIYGRYAGTEVEVGDDKIRIVRELDIYCLIEE